MSSSSGLSRGWGLFGRAAISMELYATSTKPYSNFERTSTCFEPVNPKVLNASLTTRGRKTNRVALPRQIRNRYDRTIATRSACTTQAGVPIAVGIDNTSARLRPQRKGNESSTTSDSATSVAAIRCSAIDLSANVPANRLAESTLSSTDSHLMDSEAICCS